MLYLLYRNLGWSNATRLTLRTWHWICCHRQPVSNCSMVRVGGSMVINLQHRFPCRAHVFYQNCWLGITVFRDCLLRAPSASWIASGRCYWNQWLARRCRCRWECSSCFKWRCRCHRICYHLAVMAIANAGLKTFSIAAAGQRLAWRKLLCRIILCLAEWFISIIPVRLILAIW